jgi:plasmid maintenance system antidote protein VapI
LVPTSNNLNARQKLKRFPKVGEGSNGRGAEKMGRPKNLQREELGQELGVTSRRINQIIREMGLDKIADYGELRLIEKRVVIGYKKVLCAQAEHDLELAQRNVIPIEEARRVGFQIGQVITMGLDDICQDAAEFAGLTEMQVHEALKERSVNVVHKIRREVSKL